MAQENDMNEVIIQEENVNYCEQKLTQQVIKTNEQVVNEVQKKKKKKRKKKKQDMELSSDEENPLPEEELMKKIRNSPIFKNPKIPEHLKEKYAYVENKPFYAIIQNIPYDTNVQILKAFFNTLLRNLRPDKLNVFSPVVNIEISESKTFAMMLLNDAETKKICLQLGNLELQGYKIDIRKPRSFFRKFYDSSQQQDPMENMIGIASNQEEQNNNKLFMGNIPTYVEEENVRKICQSFGVLKNFNLIKDKDSNGKAISKGYCFFEYIDPKSAEKALKALNDMEIGDKKLKVSIAIPQQKIQNIEKNQKGSKQISYLKTYKDINNEQILQMLSIPDQAIQPTKIVQFLNMFIPEDLYDEDFYDSLFNELKEECLNFGPIEHISIPRPDKDGNINNNVGKCFVKFCNLADAKKARFHLAGRSYNNRTIITSFCNENDYDKLLNNNDIISTVQHFTNNI